MTERNIANHRALGCYSKDELYAYRRRVKQRRLRAWRENDAEAAAFLTWRERRLREECRAREHPFFR